MDGKWYLWAHRRQVSSAVEVTTKKAGDSPLSSLDLNNRPARTSQSLPGTTPRPTETSSDLTVPPITASQITMNPLLPSPSDRQAVPSSRSNQRDSQRTRDRARPTRPPRTTMAVVREGISRGRPPSMVRTQTQPSVEPTSTTPQVAPPRVSSHTLGTPSVLGIVFGVAMVLLIISALFVIGRQRLRSNRRWMRMDVDEVDVERGEKGVSEDEGYISAGQSVHIPPSPRPILRSGPLEPGGELATVQSPTFPRARQVTFLLPTSRRSLEFRHQDEQTQIDIKPPPVPPKTYPVAI